MKDVEVWEHIVEDVVLNEGEIDHIDMWVPLNPQPSCHTCEHSRGFNWEVCICAKISCLFIKHEDIDTFYCEKYEKKVTP